jgi:outer membrane protein assembly factor BamB
MKFCRSPNILQRIALLLAVAMLLASCAGPEKPKPADLGPNTVLLGVVPAWNASVGPVSFPLDVRVVGSQAYVAGSNGTVVAVDAASGKDIWRMTLDTGITAGVGSDGKFAAVVSQANDLIVIEGGKVLWRQRLGALTLTAPLVAGARVFVLAADRSVSAFDAATGRRLWQQQRTGDPLVLGQAGVLTAVGDTLVVGIGGRLVGMNPLSGVLRWDAPLANGRGTNEVERLVDLVSGVSRDGDQVCVRAFQSMVGCVDASNGRVVWSKASVGSTGITGDSTVVFGTESDGKLVAWRRTDGERMWVAERLRFRGLSAPLLLGQSLVVGDATGLLHFLSRQDGSALNRFSPDGSPIVVAPVLAGGTLVVVTQRGGVFGFRAE